MMQVLLFGAFGVWLVCKHPVMLIDNLGRIEQGKLLYMPEGLLHYSSKDLHALMKKWDDSSDYLTIEALHEDLNLQRLRRTYQGYYAVIPAADSGEKLFVFMDWRFNVEEYFICGQFLSRDQTKPLIQRVSYKGTDVPHCHLPMSAAYIAYYYTDGIEAVGYTDVDPKTYGDDPTPYEYIMPETYYYLSSDFESNSLWLFEHYGFAAAPIILERDRQNSDDTAWLRNKIGDYVAIIRVGILMSSLFIFLNWISFGKAFKKQKNTVQSAQIKRYKRKWKMLYAMDIPIFLVCFALSLAVGFPISIWVAFVYLVIVILIETKQRKKLLHDERQ